jgi:hypothetical protein
MSQPHGSHEINIGLVRISTQPGTTASAFDAGITSSASLSLPDAPLRRSTRKGTTSAAAEQIPVSTLQEMRPPKASQDKKSRRELSKKRKKLGGVTPGVNEDVREYIMEPATEQDRASWKGWCEVESEPVSFHFFERFLSSFKTP